MALDSLVRNSVKIVDKITASLQVPTYHEAFVSDDGYGLPTYSRKIKRMGIVDTTPKMVRTKSGDERLCMATITYPRPIPVDERDKFTIPGGRTAPVLSLPGLLDPGTDGLSYVREVVIG